MKFRVLLVLFLTLGVCGTSLRAQDEEETESPIEAVSNKKPIYTGPIVGINKVITTGQFASFASQSQCPLFKDGSGTGFFAGWTFEYLIGKDAKTSKSSIIARVIYDNFPTSFTMKGDQLPSLVRMPDGSDQVIISEVQHYTGLKYTTLDLDLAYRFNLGDTPLGITAGPTVGFAMTQDLVQEFRLISPSNVQLVPDTSAIRYENDNRTAILQDGPLKNGNKLRLSLKVGLQYEFIMKKMTIIPSINYNVAVTNMNDESWRVNALQFGIEARFPVKIF